MRLELLLLLTFQNESECVLNLIEWKLKGAGDNDDDNNWTNRMREGCEPRVDSCHIKPEKMKKQLACGLKGEKVIGAILSFERNQILAQ